MKPLNPVSFVLGLGDFVTDSGSGLLSIPRHVDSFAMSPCVVELAAGFVELLAALVDPCAGIVTLGNAAAHLGSALVGGLTLVSKVYPRRSSTSAALPGAGERLVHALLGASDDRSKHRVFGERLQRGGQLSFS